MKKGINFKKLIAFVLIVGTMVCCFALTASAEGYIRSISKNYIETLPPDSKWQQEPLKTLLSDILSEDLSDTNNCEQVWHFEAKDFETVKDWCVSRNKGEETNQAFLNDFKQHHIK